MNKRRLFALMMLITAFVFVATSLAAPAESSAPPHKQIAAPPTEFAQLQLPNPAQTGVRSHAAMVAVHLDEMADGTWVWQADVPLDSTENVRLMVLAPEGAAWQVTLQGANGRTLDLNTPTRGITQESTQLGLSAEEGYPAQVYSLAGLQTGTYTVRVSANAPRLSAAAGPDGYLVLASDSPTQLYTHLTSHNLLVGQEIGLATYAYNAADGTDAVPTAVTGAIKSATMTLHTPDGQKQEMVMSASGDGVFVGTFVPQVAGSYVAQVVAQGVGVNGRAFLRTSEHTFPILASNLVLSEKAAETTVLENGRLQINLAATGSADTQMTIAAELWGANGSGEMVPVAWLGGLVSPDVKGEAMTIGVSVDGRWLALANARSSLELRNIRLQDINTHIPLAQLDALAVQADALPANANAAIEAISDDMLMGPQPEMAPNAPELAGVVMLIHGYCSGGVWPTSQFSQYAVFADHNQNRSHNQFAQLIASQGSAYSSFGAIAHSQGGAASLHLYTYYWSGLDYSSGNRLIQSVGTPYQGTALAGNLALLGQIFGAGCGTNFDLTYDGAGLWLSGIPSWARSRVYYHTTSFKDVWWRYDYCHIATDLFLSDPDDGTTEKWSGQLSGANNLGHKTNWCHTSGMRDTPQYLDSSRNANMNSNANR
jgi:hypothetical protein